MPGSPRTLVRGLQCFRTPEGVTTTYAELHPKDWDDEDRLLSTRQAAQLATHWRAGYQKDATVSEAAIRQWRHRGQLAPRDVDHRGRALYHRGDLADVERATRDIALNPELAVLRTP